MADLLTSDGVRLHYQLDGPADAAPVVLLHGLGSDARGYDPLVEAIAGRLLVARLDLRGHGLSEPLTDPARYGWFERAAGDIEALLDLLGWPRCGLAGGSLGAAVAIATVLRCPDRITRLALLAPAIGTGRVGDDPSIAAFLGAIAEHGLIGVLDAFVSAAPGALPPELEAEARANWSRQDDTAMRACVRALAGATLVGELADLGRIEMPTLVAGQHGDFLHPWALAQQVAAAIPGARLIGGSSDDALTLVDQRLLADTLVKHFAASA